MSWEFPGTLRALRSRNYRLFFMAQAISLTGLWMHRTAMGWLVYRLTGSNSALGIMDFAASVPIFFLTAVAGALLERWDLRKSLFFTQFCSMLTAFALAVATFTGFVSFTFTVCSAIFLGTLDAFEIPCRYSLVSYMVDRREDVANGVALNSVNFNATRMFGPTLAGFVIHAFGEGVCFLLNGFAYSSTLFAVSRMRMKRPPIGRSDGSESHPIADTLEGIRLARSFAPAKYLLMLISLTGFFAFPSLVLMPAMARLTTICLRSSGGIRPKTSAAIVDGRYFTTSAPTEDCSLPRTLASSSGSHWRKSANGTAEALARRWLLATASRISWRVRKKVSNVPGLCCGKMMMPRSSSSCSIIRCAE